MAKTNQAIQTTTDVQNEKKVEKIKSGIPMPAPVVEKLEGFQDETDNEPSSVSLTTHLSTYEVLDDIKVREALFNARNKKKLNKEGTMYIFFAKGKIDNWCAYVTKQDEDGKWRLYAPKDEFYFERVLYIAKQMDRAYPNRKESAFERVYHDILHIAEIMFFDPTTVSDTICNEIDRIIDKYASEDETYRGPLTLALYEIYYGMIAEENKIDAVTGRESVLGRKIKVIGLHDLLIYRKGVQTSCNCNKKANSNIIQSECDKLGICWLSANERKKEMMLNYLNEEI